MNSRSDLAIELLMDAGDSVSKGEGYKSEVTENESSVTTVIEIENEDGAEILGKPIGKYVTVEVPPFGQDGEVADGRMEAVSAELSKMLPPTGDILVVGLGNRDITADALGPLAMSQILATRHLSDRLSEEIGLSDLRDVSGIIPGVLGQTGIEVIDIVKSVAGLVKPVAIVSIDALAAREIARLGCTVQITDAGVAPGSGIGNARPQMNEQSMGVPVISVGVPTVISVASLLATSEGDSGERAPKDSQTAASATPAVGEFDNLIVTPKDIDLLVARAARLVSLSVNKALFPSLTTTDILSLVS